MCDGIAEIGMDIFYFILLLGARPKCRMLKAMSSQVLNRLKDGDSTTRLDNPFQCSITPKQIYLFR